MKDFSKILYRLNPDADGFRIMGAGEREYLLDEKLMKNAEGIQEQMRACPDCE